MPSENILNSDRKECLTKNEKKMKRLMLIMCFFCCMLSIEALEVDFAVKNEEAKHAWVFYEKYWGSDNCLLLPYNMPGYTFSLAYIPGGNDSQYLPIKPERSDTRIDSISYNCYFYCSLRRLDIPSSVKQIGTVAFLRNYSIYDTTFYVIRGLQETLIMQGNIDSIFVHPDNKIYDSRDSCNAIIKTSTNTLLAAGRCLKIPRSVTKIGAGAFRERDLPIIGYKIPDWIEEIGEEAYMYSHEDTSPIHGEWPDTLVIPASVKKIGRKAFFNSGYFRNIVIKASLDTIPEMAFSSGDTIEADPWVMYKTHRWTKIKNVIIENEVRYIGRRAFVFGEFERVELPAGLEYIDEMAFGLWRSDLPPGVVVCKSEIPPRCHETAFNYWHTGEKSLLVVPAESVDLYKEAPVWCEFNVVGFSGVDEFQEDRVPSVEIARYDIQGRKLNTPVKGINIVQYSDGTIRKVVER